jgi:hypothetical protein
VRHRDREAGGNRPSGSSWTAHPEAGRGRAPADTRLVLAVTGAWLVAACLVGASETFAALRPPAPQLVLVGITVVLMAAARLWPPLHRFVETVDRRALVLFHLTRFVGFYFLALHARGELPWAFAVPGGWGDIAVAASALLLVFVSRPDTPGGRHAYLAWNVVGLVDILWVVLTAARLAFADPMSMRRLLHLPLSLLLTFVVPIVIATHAWMLRRLARAAAAP